MSANYSRRHLKWVRDGTAWVVRHSRTDLARVVPDQKHPGMWRVASPDSALSEMANLSRAKDAAAGMALAILNRVETAHADGTQKRKLREAARVLSDAGHALEPLP